MKSSRPSVVVRTVILFLLFVCYYTFKDKYEESSSPAEQSYVGEGRRSIKICSQNLMRLGEKDFDSNNFYKQANFLTERIKSTKCDIIFLQELVGNKTESQRIVNRLIELLDEELKGSSFKAKLGESNDKTLRNGVVFNEVVVKLLDFINLYHDSLPRISDHAAPWSHIRGPIFVTFKLAGSENKNSPGLAIVAYHLKSKSRGFKDRSGLDFELSRVLSAASIRERMQAFQVQRSKEYIELMLGDRNTDFGSSTDKILSGELALENFIEQAGCRILEGSGDPLCPESSYKNPDFVPLLEKKSKNEHLDLSTHKFRGRGNILDEIYISAEDFDKTLDNSGQISVGVEGVFRKGSDHLLSWVEVNL